MHPADHIKNRQKSKKFMPAQPPAAIPAALPQGGGTGPMPAAAPPKRRPMFMTGGHGMMGR